MSDLIACINDGKSHFGQVKGLIKNEEWDTIFLIASKDAKNNFTCEKEVIFIDIDPENSLKNITDKIQFDLKGRLSFGDIAVNLIYGSGKEHMAVISAILKLGCGIRLTALTKDGVIEI